MIIKKIRSKQKYCKKKNYSDKAFHKFIPVHD